jgi:hypothetical protein
VTVTCKLVNRRRSVSCTVTDRAKKPAKKSKAKSTSKKQQVRASVRIAGSKRTTVRRASHRVTVTHAAGRRLSSASKVVVHVTVGQAKGDVTVRASAKSRTAALR